MRINTNIDAISAQRALSGTSNLFSKAVARLSSGLRITSAADDAAGLSISEKLRAQSRGLSQAMRNAQDSVSLVQTAEGALNEVSALLQRIRELAVQAKNGTLSSTDLDAVGNEAVALRDEITRIGNQTKFNGASLLTGALRTQLHGANTEVKVGTAVGTLAAVFSEVDVTKASSGARYTLSNPATTTVRLTGTIGGSSTSQDITASAMATATTQTFNFTTFGVKFTVAGVAAVATLLAANLANSANDRIETSGTLGTSLTVQVGSDAGQTMTVSVSDARATAVGATGTYTSLDGVVTAFQSGESSLADTLINSVDQAITDVNNVRAGLGAAQNRLEAALSNIGVGVENLSASESRIRDADIAAETVQFVKAQILQQAGTAILAQANQAPQAVLALLQ
ncbi:MAG: flagellin [Actinobacteria bacterium]|nr:flagellin [Actinomycetota bacterium]